MKSADQLREELHQVAEARKAHDKQGAELDAQTAQLCLEARDHPELQMVEAAELAGFDRRATAYDFAERAARKERQG